MVLDENFHVYATWCIRIFFCSDRLCARQQDWRFNTFFRKNKLNKAELIEHIASKSDISKAAATRALAALTDAVRKTLKKGDTVSLVGFGSFSVSKRAARTGRNPRTGAALKIKAAKVPRFKPGKALKDAVN